MYLEIEQLKAFVGQQGCAIFLYMEFLTRNCYDMHEFFLFYINVLKTNIQAIDYGALPTQHAFMLKGIVFSLSSELDVEDGIARAFCLKVQKTYLFHHLFKMWLY